MENRSMYYDDPQRHAASSIVSRSSPATKALDHNLPDTLAAALNTFLISKILPWVRFRNLAFCFSFHICFSRRTILGRASVKSNEWARREIEEKEGIA